MVAKFAIVDRVIHIVPGRILLAVVVPHIFPVPQVGEFRLSHATCSFGAHNPQFVTRWTDMRCVARQLFRIVNAVTRETCGRMLMIHNTARRTIGKPMTGTRSSVVL